MHCGRLRVLLSRMGSIARNEDSGAFQQYSDVRGSLVGLAFLSGAFPRHKMEKKVQEHSGWRPQNMTSPHCRLLTIDMKDQS